MTNPLLEVRDLKKHFPVHGGLLRRKIGEVRAVDGVNFKISKGGILGIVGESGSGKTTIGRMIARIYEPTHGSILFDGKDIAPLGGHEFKPFRRKIQMIFQDPSSSLNPRRRVGDIILDPLRANALGNERERRERAFGLLERVGLPRDVFFRYPHMLSGGQKQRIGIARAIISNPDLVILDEPTSALDVSVQAQIIELLQAIRKEFNLTYIFISHNIVLVRNFADEVLVLYLGRVMESGPVDLVFRNPKHPYSISLLSSTPTLTEEEEKILPEHIPLTGEMPSPMNIQPGCRFASRCPHVMPICSRVEPELIQVGEQFVRCHLFGEDAAPRKE